MGRPAAPCIPRVLASLARAPFVGDERGWGSRPFRVRPLPSRGGGIMALRPTAPGIPLRSRSARPRPPYAGAKGGWDGLCSWIPGCGGMTGGGLNRGLRGFRDVGDCGVRMG